MEMPIERITISRERGVRYLQAAGLSVEPLDVTLAVEKHRWTWRPPVPRILLIAESHVYTSEDELALLVRRHLLPAGAQHAPTEFVRLVYCLAYGESELLVRNPKRLNAGTIQFWDIFGKLAGTQTQPRKGSSNLRERLDWKVRTLRSLQERGVWLLDSSLHGIYAPGGLRIDPLINQALHRAWWDSYGSWLIAQMPEVKIWAIGKGVGSTLASLGVSMAGWIYQPNARGKFIDKNHGWDGLQEAVNQAQLR